MSLTQKELDNLTRSSYKGLYVPEEDTSYNSHFYKGFNHTVWHGNIRKSLEVTSNPITKIEHLRHEHNVVNATYKVDNAYDLLVRTVVSLETPRIVANPKLKGRVRMKWCKKPGPSACFRVIFKNGDTLIEEFTSQWIKTFYDWAYHRSEQSIIDDSVGNTKDMCEWSYDTIEGKELRFTIPFSYSRPEDKLSTAFPMFLLGPQSVLTKTLVYPHDIVSSLLLIEVSKDGEKWVPLPKNADLSNFITVGAYTNPSLEVKYAKITDEEKWRFMHESIVAEGQRKDIPIDEFVFPMQRVTEIRDSDYTLPGKTSTHRINLSPVTAIFCNGINGDALSRGETSNFTTNGNDQEDGISAISKVDIIYDKIVKETIRPIMMRSMDVSENLPGVPKFPGSFYYSWTNRPFKTDGMVGAVFKAHDDCKIVCTYTSAKQKQKEQVQDHNQNLDPSRLLESLIDDEEDTVYDESMASRGYITELYVMTHTNMIFTYSSNEGDRRIYKLTIP